MPELDGPGGRIGYVRDDLGYPSIDSSSLDQASWARGWFHAYDRLVQVQLTLAVASGRALALMGDTAVARYADRMTRLHRFTDDLDEQVSKLSPKVRSVLDTYADGFNTGARARGWPLLLRAAGIGPRLYTARDFLLLLRVVSWFGLNQLIEMAALGTAELISTKAPLRAMRLLLGDAATAEQIMAAPMATWPTDLSVLAPGGRGGSNAIAIAASRSATGGALLAADPHMEIGRIPPVLHASHTTLGGGRYMQGFCVPGVWYPSFGRTNELGWAFTYGRTANLEVSIARCRRGEMFDGAAWRKLQRRVTRVAVRKRPDETWTFWDCERGTIVGDVESDTEVMLPCVQWHGIRETHSEADMGQVLATSTDVETAVAGMRNAKLFALDCILADSHGRIGHVLGGVLAPGGGILPVMLEATPATKILEASRPAAVEPDAGWIVSANARPIEESGARWVPLPESHSRYERLAELVAATPKASLADLTRFLLDTCDASAKKLLGVWAQYLPDHPLAKQLVTWATAQPGTGNEHFAQLTLWTALHERACRELLHDVLGEARANRLLDDLVGLELYRYHLDAALALEHTDVVDGEQLRGLLAKAFPRALEDVARHPHKLPHTARFKNAVFQGKIAWLLDSKPIVNRGGPTTPNQVTTLTLGAQRMVFGAAGRYVCDMSKPDGWYCISGGASERRFGPGYAAGLDDWARGTFRPLGKPSGPAPSVVEPQQ